MIGDKRFLGDLIQFDLSELDVMLGINWLTTYGACNDCKALKLILRDSRGQKVCFYGDRTKKGMCCYELKVKEEEVKAEDIPVVCKFPDVFLEELSGLPSQLKIDFEIELIPSAQPISNAPCLLYTSPSPRD